MIIEYVLFVKLLLLIIIRAQMSMYVSLYFFSFFFKVILDNASEVNNSFHIVSTSKVKYLFYFF